jgi:c-di-AMP phosphodiesterase-like protein
MKKRIRLTENDLYRIVKESIDSVVDENEKSVSAKRELLNTINKILEILHHHSKEDFECLSDDELDELYSVLVKAGWKLVNSCEG